MPDVTSFGLFLTAALILAITPGPGIFYILTRSIKGGRSEGIASTLGTAIGDLGHVVAAALGVSAILSSSAVAFSVVKYAGAAYLIYLGIRTLASKDEVEIRDFMPRHSNRRVIYQGITTEILNPKTALFFLAFIPQFINPDSAVALQFILLGCICVLCNTSVGLVVAFLAGAIGQRWQNSLSWQRGQRVFSGCSFIALGSYVAVAGEKK